MKEVQCFVMSVPRIAYIDAVNVHKKIMQSRKERLDEQQEEIR
jgi:hypothetical protein